jgi:hypothetical protein
LNIPCSIHRTSSSVDDLDVPSETNQDTYGNPIPPAVDDSTEDATYDLETVCWLQQERRTEPAQAGELSDTVWTIFLNPSVDIDTSDRITVDDYGEFEVVGDPWQTFNPRTKLPWQVECTARRTGPEEIAS